MISCNGFDTSDISFFDESTSWVNVVTIHLAVLMTPTQLMFTETFNQVFFNRQRVINRTIRLLVIAFESLICSQKNQSVGG